MHHLRGKLREGDEVRLDPANVYIHFQSAKAGGQVMGWYGYLLVASEGEVEPGTYSLGIVPSAMLSSNNGNTLAARTRPADRTYLRSGTTRASGPPRPAR